MVALVDAEAEFIQAMTNGSLDVFQQTWNTLLADLNSHTLDDATATLAHVTAGHIHHLATHFLKLYDEEAAARSLLATDLESLFDQLLIDDQNVSPALTASEEESLGHPSYIAPAYKWLLNNLHAPYPSKKQKSLISRQTSTSVHHIDTWFLNVRRRIGWTAICKKYFAGSKSDAVAAATRAFAVDVHDRDVSSEPLPGNIQMAFMQMELTARELYADKFNKSTLAGKLDGLVKDMTSEDRHRKRRGKPRVKERPQTQLFEKEPSAESASASDVPLGPRGTSSPVTADHYTGKRRLPDDDDTAVEVFQPRKRSRVLSAASSCSSLSSMTSSLSSPSSSRASTPSLSEPRTPPLSYNDDFFANRHCSIPPMERAHARPKLQLVSDPFPNATYTITSSSSPSSSPSSAEQSPLFDGTYDLNHNEWSSIFFNTPESAVLGELDLSSLHAPEILCAPEMAPVFYPDDTILHALVTKGMFPTSQPNFLEQVWHEPGYPIPTDYMSPMAWANDVSHLLDMQPSTSSLSSCEVIPRQTSSAPLSNLDEFSSLTSLPSDLRHSSKSIDWLSIFPESLSPTAMADDTCTNSFAKPSKVTIAKPISITPEQRAAKLTRLHSLISQAKQLQAELVHP
uniref:HD1 homeodomain mating-type protein n=1 Tax=Pleurotus djamor TaxID=34470 RepID=Q68SS8_PLEDJ|nr:HD1 homeodomain mating-type protein [Pleurotus djamor]